MNNVHHDKCAGLGENFGGEVSILDFEKININIYFIIANNNIAFCKRLIMSETLRRGRGSYKIFRLPGYATVLANTFIYFYLE